MVEKSDLKRHFVLMRRGRSWVCPVPLLRVTDHLTILQGHTKQGCQNIQDDIFMLIWMLMKVKVKGSKREAGSVHGSETGELKDSTRCCQG